MDEVKTVVGIAEYKIAQSPELLTAYGLGSCVGVAVYDSRLKTGGLAHVMLPSSRLHSAAVHPGKYADTALEAVVGEMEKAGCRRQSLAAKIVGGANMFSGVAQNPVPIGLRNVSAVREKLREMGIPIVGEEVGGTHGRTILFHLETGRVEIRELNQPVLNI